MTRESGTAERITFLLHLLFMPSPPSEKWVSPEVVYNDCIT
jgi:hypothetical protein